ncbi:hypothetical protein TRL7639_03262 [Falsiruegeria litorea R37]|uniref:Uncharacterized protein n=1 Tax=Falsiruegeria litorea R37 TaxID=1200284 RepID=A0A1Y5T9D1_9RHOB|nr:hypothetical protein [Falsiruegeria litorea]SLN58820.1 hypothetical protein TRL7639_03262 [Falsiruegeria litorea R37]
MLRSELRLGAENLLITCAGLAAGDRLLVLQEEPDNGYYDQGIVDAVVETARELDMQTDLRTVPFAPMGGAISADLVAAMKQTDCTIFLSRTGDQIRFDASMAGIRPIMSYALDAEMLASGFGRADYAGFVALKNAVNALYAGANEIRVTCPLGTNFSGPGAAYPLAGAADVSVTRFPMSIFAPVPANGFSGVVMQDGFLVGTGSKFYDPYGCDLREPLAVHFDNTRLTHFSGHEMDVHCAQMHYEKVGKMFDLDPLTMHSWHAGIHPGCAYPMPAAENFERWSGSAFGNPRLMHFHTCGHYAPGEISLNVLDPTITIDGVAVWKEGVFDPKCVPGGAAILARYPCMQAVFNAPAQEVGQGSNGRLMGAV